MCLTDTALLPVLKDINYLKIFLLLFALMQLLRTQEGSGIYLSSGVASIGELEPVGVCTGLDLE